MSRLSHNSVVNTAYGDRQIIDLPDLGQRPTESRYVPPITQQHVLRHHRKGHREHQTNKVSTDYHLNPRILPTLQYSNSNPPQSLQYDYQPQGLPTYMSESNILQNGYVPNYVNNIQTNLVDPSVLYQQSYLPHSGYNYLPYGTTFNQRPPAEVHLYYGPNGERLPGPPPEFTGYNHVTNFTLEGTLEFGKLVSVKIQRGDISYRDIPDFLLTHLLQTFKNVSKAKIVIIAEDGKYHLYSPNLK